MEDARWSSMPWVLLEVLLLLSLFFVIILFLPLKLEVKLLKNNKKEDFFVKLYLSPGLWSLETEVPILKWELGDFLPYLVLHTETEGTSGAPISKEKVAVDKPWHHLHKLILYSPIKKIRLILLLSKQILKINRQFFKKVSCERLIWKTSLGLCDPALTAFTTGSLWTFKNITYVNLHNNVKVNFSKPDYMVEPDFKNKIFKIDFNCIFAFRIGHIIMAGYMTMKLFVKSLLAQRGWK